MFGRKRPDPEQVALKILDYFSEEELKLLNSCPDCNFGVALVQSFCRNQGRFKYRSFEAAVPIIRTFLEEIKIFSGPISEDHLKYLCEALKFKIFDGYPLL